VHVQVHERVAHQMPAPRRRDHHATARGKAADVPVLCNTVDRLFPACRDPACREGSGDGDTVIMAFAVGGCHA
jgi:hypothetical protein